MHTLLQKDQLAPGAAVTALLPEILSGLYLQQQPCSTCLFFPGGLRYHLTGGKFSFNPAIAVAANFITKKKIETVLVAAGGNENTTTGDIQGLKPAYFDVSVRPDFVYNVNRTIGISLLPSARFALSSITKDGPVKTYVNTFGLGLGLNVHF